ncbi:MAG: hypothetical protein CMG64_06080 [Candidatus Marinimicrobia bacterium]|nr:hypothetical protein [Candidatus Neomarinimicrobiota bacterium]|tara:strand:+ start:4953 stop:7256 length:2304 start_codon:yes stop_codon:yes gene_type:complete
MSYTQISQGGNPKYLLRDIQINSIEPDINNLVDRDFHPMVFQYGDEYSVNINVLESASLIIENNLYTYYLEIESRGAYGIGFIFDDFYLSENSNLFIYDKEQTMFLGSFNSLNNKQTNIFPTSIIRGDKVIIELTVPESELEIVRLNIGTLIHDYKDIMNYFNNSESDRDDCNINVACSESIGWEDQIDGAIRVTMGGGLCSASIINNTANDRTPYVLFADHCVSGSASGYVFYFNYQSSTCNGTNSSSNQSVSGSSLLVSGDINSSSDFALLEMTSDIPDSYNPFYVGWSNVSSPPQDAVGIHHPGGDIKKITQDGTNVSAGGSGLNYWEFQYNDGRVIPGSSGSPFFDENKRQVGIASYIYTNYCNPSPDCYCDQQYTHGYGRFDVAWDDGLDNYLDPLNTGVDYIDGIGASGVSISHIPLEDMPFTDSELLVTAQVSAYSGIIESVELHYNIGDRWEVQEMSSSFSNSYNGVISGIYDGMIVQYYITAVNSEGIIESFPSLAPDNVVTFIVGDLPDIYFTDFEQGIGDWILGDSQDDATAGIWELADPVATFNDDGYQLQPEDDYSINGIYCLITGNGFENGNGGFDDVDNGRTTVYSPIINLSDFETVVISYAYWYTNNIGDNGGNDLWQVLVSNNGGNSWQDLHISSNSNTDWERKKIILLNDLTDSMQFKFIAEDIAYPGDDGSGGSLVEAALDDFLIEYVGPAGVLGDINNDEEINVLDVVLLVNMILGSEPENLNTADINSDNQLNVQDIVILISMILE